MGLQLLSKTVPKVTGKTFSRKYIALGKIFDLWPEIMGPEMADKAMPVKIRYQPKKNQRAKPEARLDIAAPSAVCGVLVYRKELILQKLNRLFGDNWITDIRFIHTDDIEKHSRPRPGRRKTLSPQSRVYLSEILEEVTDPDIKERLSHFGESYLKDRES